jgi:hypothetical protein
MRVAKQGRAKNEERLAHHTSQPSLANLAKPANLILCFSSTDITKLRTLAWEKR